MLEQSGPNPLLYRQKKNNKNTKVLRGEGPFALRDIESQAWNPDPCLFTGLDSGWKSKHVFSFYTNPVIVGECSPRQGCRVWQLPPPQRLPLAKLASRWPRSVWAIQCLHHPATASLGGPRPWEDLQAGGHLTSPQAPRSGNLFRKGRKKHFSDSAPFVPEVIPPTRRRTWSFRTYL